MGKNTIPKLEKMYGQVMWTDKPHNFLGMAWNFTRFILTEKKLIVRKGFLNITEEYVDLYKVMDSAINLPLGQRMFGCGTVTITSKDPNNKHLILEKIKNPHDVNNKIEAAVEAMKQEYGILGKDMYGAARSMGDADDCDCDDCDDE